MSYCDFLELFYGDEAVYCEDFEKGEYDQVWTVAGGFMLITLGITFSNFSQFANQMNNLSTVVAKARRQEEVDEAQIQAEMFDPDNIAGYSLSQYIILQSILILIMFVAKILLITDDSLEDANKAFDDASFEQWMTSQNLLAMYIFTGSTSTSSSVLKMAKMMRDLGHEDKINPIAKCCLGMFGIDMIGSFVMCCIKYGYLVLALYMFAVAFLCGLMVVFTVCCWAPLIFGVAMVLKKVFAIFACGKEKCEQLFDALANAIALNGLAYMIVVLVLVFMWLFVGGPEADYIGVFDNSNQLTIFYCLLTSTIYGFLVMLGGFARAATL